MQGPGLRASTYPWLCRLPEDSGLLRYACFASNPPSPPALHIPSVPRPPRQVSSISISSRVLIDSPRCLYFMAVLLLGGAACAVSRAAVAATSALAADTALATAAAALESPPLPL